MPDSPWTLLGSRAVSEHGLFRIRYDRYRLEPTGMEKDFIVLASADWVNMVPLTADGQVVLIRQFRHGIRRDCLEIPGGMVDAGEQPQQAALRELKEETGYVPGRVRLLGRISPNPAIQDNWCYSFLAEDCRPLGEPQPEPFEHLEILLRPLAEIPELIRREEICHTLVINAFALLGVLGNRP